MSESILSTKIKAYDEFSLAFKRFQDDLKKTGQAQKEAGQSTDQLNRSVSSLFQALGSSGALYAFQRGLREIMQTGREFEKTIRQTQIIVDDFSSTLHDAAMAGKSLFTPTETAQAYRELGAAGLSTNEILKSSPDIMNFSIAAMIDMTASAESVIAAVKGFNLSFQDSEKVVDTFSVAMDRTTLAGNDFSRALASVGPVAGGLAKQSLGDTLALVAALKDMGARADDAATSARSMLLQLINPTKEASDTMKQLGIEIYDSTGNLKTIPDIIAAFESALAPLDQKSKQLIMTTVAGSDGIRALSAGLATGSVKLRELSVAMDEGQGRAAQYAEIMGETFDGSVRKVTASWEKLKIAMFEDFESGTVDILGVVNTMLTGFNNLDAGGRAVIEMLIGAAGLSAAISALIAAARTLGITLATFAGPVGWLAAIAGLLATVSTATLAYKGHIEQMNQELRDSIKENISQANSIETLLAKYEQLSAKTNLTESEQDQLKKTVKSLTDAVPSAITGFDAMGEAITNVAIASQKAREEMVRLREEAVRNAQINADIARAQMPELERKAAEAKKQRDLLQGYMSIGNYQGAYLSAEGSWKGLRDLKWLFSSDEDIAFEVGQMAAQARDAFDAANKELTAAQSAIKMAEDLSAGKTPEDATRPAGQTPGGVPFTPFGGPGGGQRNEAVDYIRQGIAQITDYLYDYQSAVEQAAAWVAVINTKANYLVRISREGER